VGQARGAGLLYLLRIAKSARIRRSPDFDCRGNLPPSFIQAFKRPTTVCIWPGCEPEMNVAEERRRRYAGRRLQQAQLLFTSTSSNRCGAVFMRVIEYARAMGLDMIQGDHEDAPGQLGAHWMFDDCLAPPTGLTTLSADSALSRA